MLAALEAGFTKLGFSDHTPFPYDDGFVNTDKMDISELEGYISSVNALRKKYQGRIQILLGLECEAVERFFPFLAAQKERMDYLILGNHGDKTKEDYFGRIRTPEGLWHYVETAVKGMETGLFLYLAHPDLMLNSYPQFDVEAENASRTLCRAAVSLGVPLEYNLLGASKGAREGMLGYPCLDFWRIAAQEGAAAVLGVDAHQPGHLLAADMEGAAHTLRGLGLTVLEDPTAAK